MFGALWSTSDNFYMGMQNGTKLEEWSGQIFDFHFQCWYNPQFVPPWASAGKPFNRKCLPPTLYVNVIATYISGVRVIIIIRAYNIDDLYHIGRINTFGIGLIIVYFLVVICTVLLTYFITRWTSNQLTKIVPGRYANQHCKEKPYSPQRQSVAAKRAPWDSDRN